MSEKLSSNWLFIREDNPEFARVDYVPSACWKTVRVPHDWAIDQPFDKMHDAYATKIVQNGETTETMHYGRTGSLPHVGIGWYRRELRLADSDKGKRLFLEFDGIMSHATVYVNGQKLAYRPFGYSSFSVDFTDVAVFDGKPNVIAVKVDNPPRASRWYPGAGIYREVRFVSKNPSHFVYNGIGLWADDFDFEKRTATLHFNCETQNTEGCTLRINVPPNLDMMDMKDRLDAMLQSFPKDWPLEDCLEQMKTQAQSDQTAAQEANTAVFETFAGAMPVQNIDFWTPEDAKLHTIKLEIIRGEETLDSVEIDFGFRKLEFDANTGMKLNGQPYYLKGVCMHHDLGPLGAAYNHTMMDFRLKQLKDIGCNAIRTSHNPPAPQMLDLCDRKGLLVMDEAFDSWELRKCENDYSTHFQEWHERDLTDFIKRDRNHPCVAFWSIGNEINEQSVPDGRRVAQQLADICHRVDPSRLVAAGLDRPDGDIQNGLPLALDLVGWNYKPHRYEELHKAFPDKPQFGSETASTVSSRGEYFFPVSEGQGWKTRPECLHCSDYGVEFPPWATTPDKEFKGQDDHPWIFGEFVWTGFDYLGEPTPFDEKGPAHSSYFGFYDLGGLAKDRALLYQARWSDKKVLNLVPHWTWPGREGQVTPVHVFTNYDCVELFVNGVSAGIRNRGKSSWRLCWDDVVYQPGIIRAVAYDKDHNILEEQSVTTATKPTRLVLAPQAKTKTMYCALDEICLVVVMAVDAHGALCPLADFPVTFQVTGKGEMAAVCNGDPTCQAGFTSDTMPLFHGMCSLFVRVGATSGNIKITARAKGLPLAKCYMEAVCTYGDAPVIDDISIQYL